MKTECIKIVNINCSQQAENHGCMHQYFSFRNIVEILIKFTNKN